jgi:uncharacterized protein (DUF697 family)
MQQTQRKEIVMHGSTCNCQKCRSGGSVGFEVLEFPMTQETYGELEAENLFGEIVGETYGESPFSEAEEMELAMELLSVSSEEELDQFLGKFLKRAWKGVKKVGAGIAKVARPFVKAALPLVGGALGSFIPIPGVGTAVGSALGGALGKALEMEFAGMELEDREFEMARRVVRIAGSAAQQAAQAAPNRNPQAAMQAAWMAAARRHVPQLAQGRANGFTPSPFHPASGSAAGGRWFRRGGNIVLLST